MSQECKNELDDLYFDMNNDDDPSNINGISSNYFINIVVEL